MTAQMLETIFLTVETMVLVLDIPHLDSRPPKTERAAERILPLTRYANYIHA